MLMPQTTLSLNTPIEDKTKEILDGYMVQRPTHLEISVKSPLIKGLFAKVCKDNIKTNLNWGKKLYVLDDDMGILTHCLNKNKNILFDSNGYPNLTYLRAIDLDEGIKVKIRGVMFPSDVEDYQESFIKYTCKIIRLLQLPKKTEKYAKFNISDMLRKKLEIRKGNIYDAFGWVHMANKCSCTLNIRIEPVLVCDECNSFGVKLYASSHGSKPFGSTT